MRINKPDMLRSSFFKADNTGNIPSNISVKKCVEHAESDISAPIIISMATYIIITVILSFLLTGCQTLDLLTKKYSSLYSETEKIILGETTASINFKSGYDPDLDIDYVYKAGQFTEKDVNAGLPGMKKVLLKYPKEDVVIFYEKIVGLKETQVWKMNRFRDKKKWTDYTYLQTYILPETELYLSLLEKNVFQIDTQYKETIAERKEEIKKQTEDNLQKKQEAYEKKIREERRPSWR